MFAVWPVALLGACASQPAYERPDLVAPPSWSNAPIASPTKGITPDGDWWTLLGDATIDRLVRAGLDGNPSVAEAAARVDQARAVLSQRTAAGVPRVDADAAFSVAEVANGSAGGTAGQASVAAGLRLAWELDLWGRISHSTAAARSRLSARTAEAMWARLILVGDISDTALALRACELTESIRDRDIVSREAELRTTRARFVLGSVAAATAATAEANLASARTDRIALGEACWRLANALGALTGHEAAALRAPSDSGRLEASRAAIPTPPSFVPALPATVLLHHPAIVAAEREVAARWSEIAVARADRLPRVDLAAVLTGEWIRALGSSAGFLTGSTGGSLAAPIFDGGSGIATEQIAKARYREALAQLSITVRNTIRDIEDGLAARQSADGRIENARTALEAARIVVSANEARWRAGAIAPYELEESRRQFNRAQENEVVAASDRARAWIALVRRTGSAAEAGS